jgi:Na+/H+ antiporter NhaD/arsenite permease-like protein
MDGALLPIIVFLLVYVALTFELVNKAVAALFGVMVLLIMHVVDEHEAVSYIDTETIMLLLGMMTIVAILRRTGVFTMLSVRIAALTKGSPLKILIFFSVVTAVLSAFLDNVTTVLLIAPITLLVTEELKVNPYPYLFAEIFSSNIGGTATLIGDPPNIMIGSAVGLTFNEFLLNLAPIVPVIMLVTLFVIYLVWGRGLSATEEARERIMQFREQDAITDPLLMKQSLSVLALVVLGFIFAHPLHLEPATIAMFGAGLLLLITNLGRDAEEQTEDVHGCFGEVEWVTIFFFVGLFIVVTGIEHAGLLGILANWVVEFTGGDMTVTAVMILWVSAVASAVVDNIPFVATMIPVIESMSSTFGGGDNLNPLWWSLALGACLGGNGSLVGASANLIVAGFAERAGHRIKFLPFMMLAFPLMLLSIVIATLYVYLRYL